MLSLERLLIKILDMFGNDTYLLTSNSKVVTGFARVTYRKSSKTVSIVFWFNASSAIPTSEDIFSGIKNEHRPSGSWGGFFAGNNGGTQTYYNSSRVTASGGVQQALSANCTGGIGYIEYVL